jgi:hypothetical protein
LIWLAVRSFSVWLQLSAAGIQSLHQQLTEWPFGGVWGQRLLQAVSAAGESPYYYHADILALAVFHRHAVPHNAPKTQPQIGA